MCDSIFIIIGRKKTQQASEFTCPYFLCVITPQIRRIKVGSVARKDGRLKRGDRIVSVNGLSLSGLGEKSALLVLRDATAGDRVELVINRKLGRRTTLPPTPMPGSSRLSRYCSYMEFRGGYIYIIVVTYKF